MSHNPVLKRMGVVLGSGLIGLIAGVGWLYLVATVEMAPLGGVPAGQWVTWQLPISGTLRDMGIDGNGVYWSHYNAWPISNDPPCAYSGPYPVAAPLSPPEEIWDICQYDLASGVVTVTHHGGNLNFPGRDHHWLVFSRNIFYNTIEAKNLSNGDLFTVWATGIYTPTLLYPRLAEPYTLFSPVEGGLMLYDLDQQAVIPVVPAVAGRVIGNYDLDGQTVVWSEGLSPTLDLNIMGYDIATATTFTISIRPGDETGVRIDQGMVVWQWNEDIYGYRLSNQQPFSLTRPGIQTAPDISYPHLTWLDSRNGEWDIYSYDLSNGQEWRVTPTPAPGRRSPQIWDTQIGWLVGNNSAYASEIHLARFLSEWVYLPVTAGN